MQEQLSLMQEQLKNQSSAPVSNAQSADELELSGHEKEEE